MDTTIIESTTFKRHELLQIDICILVDESGYQLSVLNKFIDMINGGFETPLDNLRIGHIQQDYVLYKVPKAQRILNETIKKLRAK